MHSSRMRTAHSLPYGGVSVRGDLCQGAGSLSRGVSVQGWSLPGGSLYRGSLSRGVFVQGGLCPGEGVPWQRPPPPREQNHRHV